MPVANWTQGKKTNVMLSSSLTKKIHARDLETESESGYSRMGLAYVQLIEQEGTASEHRGPHRSNVKTLDSKETLDYLAIHNELEVIKKDR